MVFSGFNPETGVYDIVGGRWGYEGSPATTTARDWRGRASGGPEIRGTERRTKGGPRLCHRRRVPPACRLASEMTTNPTASRRATRPCSTPVVSSRS